MKQKIVIILCSLLFIVQCKAICELRISNITKCASIEDVYAVSLQSDWTKLEVNGKKLATLLPDGFQNVPNIKELVFVRTVNYIKYNAFKSLNSLEHLFFYDCDLYIIKRGMFTYTPVASLAIVSSKASILQPGCFYKMPNLKAVLIYKNAISHIAAAIFSHTNIEILILNNNEIRTIEDEAFYAMEKLKILGLESNYLISFEPELLIGPHSPDLQILWLARNEITRISAYSYINLPKLEILSLQINAINIIEENSFIELHNLRYLDISNNYLEALPANVFPAKGLTFLDILFLQNNRLTYLSNDIINKFPRLRNITIGGNPWQCVCYVNLRKQLLGKNIDILCDKDYFDGVRPVCIFPETFSNVCKPQEENSKELFNLFTEAIQGYIKLPRECNLNCGNNKSCYSENIHFDFNFWVGLDAIDNRLLR